MDYKIEINADELPFIREKVMKCKVIALNDMDKHPLLNPKFFTKSLKDLLLKKIRYLYDTNTLEEINERFNTICNEKLFDSGIDYSNFPVYIDNRFPSQNEKILEEEGDLEKLKEDIKTNKLIKEEIIPT